MSEVPVERLRDLRRMEINGSDKQKALDELIRIRTRRQTDTQRMDWLERYAHALGWTKDGERLAVRADDGVEFVAETWRDCIDLAIERQRG